MRASWRGIRCHHEECAKFGICLVGPPLPDLDADPAANREAAEEPCPTCGGSMRFCECMDDPFASTEDSEGVGTGAGEGATGQDTGTAWVTRSEDCPEAPAQARPLGPDVGEHDPRCYQRTGVPDDMPTKLCDCRVLRMVDAEVER